MFKKAFTLAEILIVMAIIGTVAVATIPNLVDSYQEDKDVAKLRSVYHDLEVAYAKAVAEYGPYNQWTGNKRDVLMKYLKASSCGNSVINSCYPSGAVGNVKSSYKYELENGVGLSINKNMTSIYVALGGAKGKTQSGRQIFLIKYSDANGIYPNGKGGDRNPSTGAFTSSYTGHTATNWVIANGNMDYLRCADKLNWTNQTSCP